LQTLEVPTIAASEYAARREALLAGMERTGLDALVVFYPARVAYLTGFHHIPTERPIVFVLGPGGRSALVVPAVEKEHAEHVGGIDHVEVYFEYPGQQHPMERLTRVAAPDVPAMPFNHPQEEAFLPNPGKIAAAMRKLAAY